jgi:hypothetical protein
MVPTHAMKMNYPPDVRHRVFSARQHHPPFGITRLIIDDFDCMPSISDDLWMRFYSHFNVTDVFKSPSGFADWLMIRGTVDVKFNDVRFNDVREMVRVPWF